MATFAHVAVGMVAARGYRTSRPRLPLLAAVALWSFLSLLPDLDVIGFKYGVRYADAWGHRGATHSLAFALFLGGALGALAPLVKLPAIRTALFAAVVIASHGLLDTLTDGGLGCALLWPFDETRYFAPWNPIPVAPIGKAFLSSRGLSIFATELVFSTPLLLWFFLPRKTSEER